MDEQRHLVAQWKRKNQKVHGEMNDMKLLLEEQMSRNVLLEKKQRKFDAEIGSLQEELRQEETSKDKMFRELDEVKRTKYSLEDQLQVGGEKIGHVCQHWSPRPDPMGTVAITIFTWNLFVLQDFEKWWRTTCENSDHYQPWLWFGLVDQLLVLKEIIHVQRCPMTKAFVAISWTN